MSKDLILSNIYLTGVLPVLEEIVQFDSEAKEITKNWNCSIQFDVSGGPKVSLIFKDGKLEVKREKISHPSIAFWFPNPQILNKMFEGKGVVPPWKGFWHLGLLKKFDSLTKKIENYLRPSKEFLQNEENLKFYLTLTLYILIWGIKAVGENDDSFKVKRANSVISKFPSCVFQVEILPDGPCGYIVCSDGKFLPSKGKHPAPTSKLQIKDINTAYKMFNDELDFMLALGTLDLKIIGLISFAEALSIIMEKLSEYLPK